MAMLNRNPTANNDIKTVTRKSSSGGRNPKARGEQQHESQGREI
jgi:hypothetical protein